VEKKLHVRPLGRLARLADALILLPMYGLSICMYLRWGSWESPQLTHRWNNTHLKYMDVEHLDDSMMVYSASTSDAVVRTSWLPRFHIPILGGWREYVVLEPDEDTEWHVGWISDRVGVSRLTVRGPVRMLLGSAHVMFFGIRAKDGVQIRIRQKAIGRIGDGGPSRNQTLQ